MGINSSGAFFDKFFKLILEHIKILLDDTKPPIWRRVLIPNNFTLHDLHLVLQASFNWHNYHLYGFNLADEKQAVDIKGQNWEEFGVEDSQVDSRKLSVQNLLNDENKYLHYEYDFGDGWRHTIQFEKERPEIIKKPKLIKANNYAPVEDCGAIWGWYDNLETLKNYPEKPTEDEESILEWMAESIPELDPEKPKEFDPTKVDFEEIAARVSDYKDMENVL